jgi:hypothetical protein
MFQYIKQLQLEIMENTLVDKTFRDSNGEIVVVQMPNLPLIVWIVASLLALIFTSGKINTVLDVLANGSLFTWAWMELFQGVNYFRRALGLAVLIALSDTIAQTTQTQSDNSAASGKPHFYFSLPLRRKTLNLPLPASGRGLGG